MATANDRLRDRLDGIYSGSLILAVLVHLLVFHFSPTFVAADWTRGTTPPPHVLPPVADPELPEAPEAPPRPAAPVATPDIDVSATIEPIGFADVPDLPPPPPGVGNRAITTENFVPFQIAPRLLEPALFQRALMEAYPSSLRSAGLGGVVTMILEISAEGRVLGASVGASSGYPLLDRAALSLTDEMRFSPALNRDQPVAVRVSIPIEFRIRGG